MKLLIFLQLLLIICLSNRLKKSRKHILDIFNATEAPEMNQTHTKMLTQLYTNFNENEQMTKILEVFGLIKKEVQYEDSLLLNISQKVNSLNEEIARCLNNIELIKNEATNVSTLSFNQNISKLVNIKNNMIVLLNVLHANSTRGYSYENETFIENVKNASNETNLTRNSNNSRLNSSEFFSFKNKELKIEISHLGFDEKKQDDFNDIDDNNRRKELDYILKFDYLFSLMKEFHRSHKLKNKISKDIDLQNIQLKTDMHKQILIKTNESNLNSTFINKSNSSNNSIEKTLEEVSSIKSNLLTELETIQVESNILFNTNQNNKLERMNLENYLSEQSLLIKTIIKDLKKTRKLFENLKNQKAESQKSINNFNVLWNSTKEGFKKNPIVFTEMKQHSFLSTLFFNQDFY